MYDDVKIRGARDSNPRPDVDPKASVLSRPIYYTTVPYDGKFHIAHLVSAHLLFMNSTFIRQS